MANEQRMRPRKRKKVCAFCVDKMTSIDYKDTAKLRRYLSERGKILPRRTTGTCAAHQRDLTTAIKRARQIALYLLAKETITGDELMAYVNADKQKRLEAENTAE